MEQIYDRKLLSFIKYTPIVVIGLATFIIIAIMFRDNRIEAQENLESLRTDYIQQGQKRVQQEVDSVYQQLVYEKAHTEAALKAEIKQRVYEAHTIVSSIYKNNQDKPRDEVIKLIKDVLRDVRFNEGRGYFFIYQMDGRNILLPPLKEFEGEPLWEMQDSRDAFIIQDLASIIEKHGEGFHRWWFYKPHSVEQDLEKIGFVKYFEPLDWFIGTGEYVEDFEAEIQTKLLAWISEIRFGNSGYVFVINKDATIIAHQDDEMRGFDGFNLHDSEKNFYIRELINTAQSGGGFVRYQAPYKPEGITTSDKSSYVRWFDQWQWAIGSGIYLSEMEAYLDKKERTLVKQNDSELAKLIIFSTLLASVMFVLAAYLSGRLSTRFRKFQARINRDFNELTNTKDKMQHMALYDSLTDLPNRIQFNQLVKKHIQEAELSGRLVAIVLVDLDNFKKLNDMYGHSYGDKLLAMLSRRFESIMDAGESVSRLGGDEFIFCYPGLVKKEELKDKLEIIQRVFSDKFVIDSRNISISSSIGVVTYPDDGLTAEELVSNADIALYRAKGSQKGSVQYFDTAIAKQVEYEFALEEEIRGALSRGEFDVAYQPLIDSDSGMLIGVEALCRWNNRRFGSVSPVEFIGIAEEIDIIHDIGQFVLKKACKDVLSCSANGDGALKLSVNISPVQLKHPDFKTHIVNVVKESGMEVSRLTLEITENVFLEDLELITPILSELKSVGFGISLDDFGTGFSSLSYLNNLPISEIKIDRTFTSKLLTSQRSESLVKAIIAIGKTHDMHIVAEGVETGQQYARLIELGCNSVQGFYFEKPVPIEKVVMSERSYS